MKALRGKPKAKHIESELLSAVVRTAPPAGCRSPAGERGRNTDFSDALGDRRIEEIQPPRFAGASPRKGHGHQGSGNHQVQRVRKC
ncbi:hypothetical protein D0Y56_10935 [Pseudomonas aeruginosa]|nr:hypothetical protein D0Y56_10935 [Pseudomonas aeruginosa]